MRILEPSFFWLFLLFVPLLWMMTVNFRHSYNFLFRVSHSDQRDQILDFFWIKKFLSFLCLFLNLLFLILALSGFSRRVVAIKETASDVDIVFLVDISNSMLARDSNAVSRLDNAKRLIRDLGTRFQRKSYNFSLVAYKGRAETFLPLTTNYLYLDNLLEALSPLMIETRGTQFFAGLKEAKKHLSDPTHQKVIILLSDGDDWSTYEAGVLQDINLEGIKLVVLGLGGRNPISFSDVRGQPVVEKNGRSVLVRQEEAYLKRLASDADGLYLNVFEQGISNTVNEVEETLFSFGLNNRGIELVSIYRWFLLLSFVFFLLHLSVIKARPQGML